MTSSISHSEPRYPVFALQLLAAAFVTWGLCVLYSVYLNPEVRFYTGLAEIQDRWAARMESEHTNKVVVFGGSSCLFSVDGEQLLHEFGLPTVNRGLAAGMGFKVTTLHALHDLKRGDTAIIAFEPALFTRPFEPSALSVQFSYARSHPEWATSDVLALPPMDAGTSLLALRPGSYHLVTLLGKLAMNKPMYRYDARDAHASGWLVTDLRASLKGPPGHGDQLATELQEFLPAFRDWGATHGVRIAYSLPWSYCPAPEKTLFQQRNAQFLSQVAEFIPVLKDEHLGAITNADYFADTIWHLTETASRQRTAELGRSLKAWDVWKVEELQALMKPGTE